MAFDEVYCVNLARRKDRWQEFLAQVPDPWPFAEIQRFEAVDGKKCPHPPWWKHGGGAWGCYRSHLAILESAINRNVESVLFLEDDAQFPDDFESRTLDFIDALPDDWGMIYLGGQHLRQRRMPPKKIAEGVYQPANVNRTHAFAIRGNMKRIVYKHLVQMRPDSHHHIDHYLGHLHEKRSHPIYCPGQWLVGQREGKSNINGKQFDDRIWAGAEDIAEIKPQEHPFVAVVGLHSSGSSVTAGVLHHLGLHLGNQLTGYYGNDPNGNCGFEAVGLRDICEKALPDFATDYAIKRGRIWAKLKGWINQKRREATRRKTIAAGKYPHLCAFPNQLRNICGDKLRIVDCERPIEESIESLQRRCPNKDADKIAAHQRFLWEHKRELLESVPHVSIPYAELLDDPRRQINRIAEYLEIEPDAEQIETAANYVDPNKRHIKMEKATA